MEGQLKLYSWLVLLLCTQSAHGIPSRTVTKCSKEFGHNVLRFEVLPGGGWDNLRNARMGQVMDVSYSDCQITEDGKYLIPDNMDVVPVKTSSINKFAETFDHWDSYTSSTSVSINAHGGGLLDDIGVISGKFSSEFENIKSHQQKDDSMTARIQVRFTRYKAILRSGAKISHAFKRRLRKIAALHTIDATASARYEAQLLVREFGTHCVTAIDAGAIITQVDQVKRSFVSDSEHTDITVKESASVSFFGLFDFGYSVSVGHSSQTASSYQSSVTSSTVGAQGGPSFKPSNFSAADWTDQIDNNLVAIDRSGDPIYLLVNDENLPLIPSSVIQEVYNYVRHAVSTYYQHNTYFGCTDRDSANFNYLANSNDGTCSPPEHKFPLGGVYQTCSQSGSNLANECDGVEHKNPVTGALSCPEGFTPVLLDTSSETRIIPHRSCHRCWIFAHCCKDDNQQASIEYSAYWCAAIDSNTDQRLVLGGTFTSSVRNIVTQSKTCPKNFNPMNVLEDLSICINQDADAFKGQGIPFGGFFSCIAGNPYAKQGNSLSFSGCPKGYSRHLVSSGRGCDIHVCIKSSGHSSLSLPVINLPPFMKAPRDSFLHANQGNYTLSPDGTVWTSIGEDAEIKTIPKPLQSYFNNIQSDNMMDIPMEDLRESFTRGDTPTTTTGYSTTVSTNEPSRQYGSAMSDGRSSNSMSVAGIVSISVVSTIASIGIATALIFVIRRKRSMLYTNI